MTLTVDLEPRQHYLRATVSGSYTLRSAQDVYDEAVKAAIATGHTRVLLDASAVTGVPTQDERYVLGLFVAAEQRILAARTPPVDMQVAVIGQRPLIDPDRFGETVAFVGPTGAGKSSLMKLLSRMYDPQRGEIRVDGQNIRDVTLASLRGQMGIVLQESFLFAGTIRDNIRYGRPEATEEEVIAAARLTESGTTSGT